MTDQRHKEDEIVRLLAGHQQRLSGYIHTLIPGHADAEDVLQEVNLFIWRHAEDYELGTNFGAWAFQVARYHVLGFRGRQPREALRFSDAVLEQLAAVAGPEPELSQTRIRVLRSCLEKLSDKDRILIGLRYEPGATTQSVAERAGRSLKGVYHSLNRIRTVLMECVQQTLAIEGRSA